jgi:hypothetical protein
MPARIAPSTMTILSPAPPPITPPPIMPPPVVVASIGDPTTTSTGNGSTTIISDPTGPTTGNIC